MLGVQVEYQEHFVSSFAQYRRQPVAQDLRRGHQRTVAHLLTQPRAAVLGRRSGDGPTVSAVPSMPIWGHGIADMQGGARCAYQGRQFADQIGAGPSREIHGAFSTKEKRNDPEGDMRSPLGMNVRSKWINWPGTMNEAGIDDAGQGAGFPSDDGMHCMPDQFPASGGWASRRRGCHVQPALELWAYCRGAWGLDRFRERGETRREKCRIALQVPEMSAHRRQTNFLHLRRKTRDKPGRFESRWGLNPSCRTTMIRLYCRFDSLPGDRAGSEDHRHRAGTSARSTTWMPLPGARTTGASPRKPGSHWLIDREYAKCRLAA